jgi:hypothetical protein
VKFLAPIWFYYRKTNFAVVADVTGSWPLRRAKCLVKIIGMNRRKEKLGDGKYECYVHVTMLHALSLPLPLYIRLRKGQQNEFFFVVDTFVSASQTYGYIFFLGCITRSSFYLHSFYCTHLYVWYYLSSLSVTHTNLHKKEYIVKRA